MGGGDTDCGDGVGTAAGSLGMGCDGADSRGQGRTGHGQVSGTEQLSSSDHQLSAAARIWNDCMLFYRHLLSRCSIISLSDFPAV